MTETTTLVPVVDSSKFRTKIAPDVVIAFDGVPMVAHCPDPFSIALTMDTLEELQHETNVDKIRAQLRGTLANILSAADAARVEEMMADPAYPDTTPDTILGMFQWLLSDEDDESPKWADAINAHLEKSQAGAAPKTRRVAAKKASAPAKKTAAKKAAAAAARGRK